MSYHITNFSHHVLPVRQPDTDRQSSLFIPREDIPLHLLHQSLRDGKTESGGICSLPGRLYAEKNGRKAFPSAPHPEPALYWKKRFLLFLSSGYPDPLRCTWQNFVKYFQIFGEPPYGPARAGPAQPEMFSTISISFVSAISIFNISFFRSQKSRKAL